MVTASRQARVSPPTSVNRILHRSEPMKMLMQDVSRVAQTNATVLLLGESGTGKELLAEAIHNLSHRAQGPFITINCPAIPDSLLESELFGHEKGAFTGAIQRLMGKLEYADGGTLFLDEIGDVPPSMQVKLLRFMETHAIERVGGSRPIWVDVRVVCATHRNLESLVADKTFREDLYYRINQVSLKVPPVRERPGDIMLLANHFLKIYAEELRRPLPAFSIDAVQAINEHDWKGNVREIGNRVKRAVIMSKSTAVTAFDLGLSGNATPASRFDLRQARLRAEAEVVRRALEESRSNVSQAAKLLGVSRPTLYALMRQVRTD